MIAGQAVTLHSWASAVPLVAPRDFIRADGETAPFPHRPAESVQQILLPRVARIKGVDILTERGTTVKDRVSARRPTAQALGVFSLS